MRVRGHGCGTAFEVPGLRSGSLADQECDHEQVPSPLSLTRPFYKMGLTLRVETQEEAWSRACAQRTRRALSAGETGAASPQAPDPLSSARRSLRHYNLHSLGSLDTKAEPGLGWGAGHGEQS